MSTPSAQSQSAAALSAIAREIEEFVAAVGWDQAPQLFALVPTRDLLSQEPELADELDQAAEFTPIAQDALPSDDLEVELAKIAWPETVSGCALTQEIVILPPSVEDELAKSSDNETSLRQVAAEHPERQEARLIAAVLRNGSSACLLRLRGKDGADDEFVTQDKLAPNLIDALLRTLQP